MFWCAAELGRKGFLYGFPGQIPKVACFLMPRFLRTKQQFNCEGKGRTGFQSRSR